MVISENACPRVAKAYDGFNTAGMATTDGTTVASISGQWCTFHGRIVTSEISRGAWRLRSSLL